MMFPQKLNDRQRAFVLISNLVLKDQAFELLPFTNPNEQNDLEQAFQFLSQKKPKDRQKILMDELCRLSGPHAVSFSLADIHLDWILESLLQESPRMISTILRYLPGEKVHPILEQLPNTLLKNMPPLQETFSVDVALVKILKQKFEQLFIDPMFEGPSFDRLCFENLYCLPHPKLVRLFRRVGLRELAMAFSTLKKSSVEMILKRFPSQDAKLLEIEMAKKNDFHENRLKQAQSHFLALEPDQGDADNLMLTSGFFVYSKAIGESDLKAAFFMKLKFPKHLGNQLAYYLEKNMPHNTTGTAARYRNEIEETACHLFASSSD